MFFFSGDGLEICTNEATCCTQEMESHLKNESENEFQRTVQDKLIGLRIAFQSEAQKFDGKCFSLY